MISSSGMLWEVMESSGTQGGEARKQLTGSRGAAQPVGL
jgi:hypothetical protein